MDKYKGILLDIDNTLYNYDITHKIAKNQVLEFCINELNLEKDIVENAYEIGRKKVHIELSETAASHNRLLYFQKMCEILNINSLDYAFRIYNIYWDTFLENMTPFDGIYDFLEKYKNKICLVTDLTAHIQYRKIEKLKLNQFIDKIVTSEEAGREKPHPYMFMLALEKLNLGKHEVCMIGDSFKKDILGASNLGIDSIWFNHENKQEKYNNQSIKEVTMFEKILELI
ncbi:HAD family hydrolase [Aliarcobacter cryaerophilus]|uniref:HAD family hydrolase n=1 Tax=Aliarcobacter cryaerophilus TaxID=28198 RepID=UPI0021B1A9A7|nr:HAD family hydrolase [Aliarcobacter cryaerophilus]MCT7433177.1 HAD family hydrolase [Aliarcobacter cryaerophilus]